MTDTTPESMADAASEQALKANTKHWIKAEWEDQSGIESLGTWRRLACADRSLFAMNHIQGILMKDWLGKLDQDDSGVEFDGLRPGDVEALMVASIELGARAEQYLYEVRTNTLDCNGTAIRGHAQTED